VPATGGARGVPKRTERMSYAEICPHSFVPLLPASGPAAFNSVPATEPPTSSSSSAEPTPKRQRFQAGGCVAECPPSRSAHDSGGKPTDPSGDKEISVKTALEAAVFDVCSFFAAAGPSSRSAHDSGMAQ